MFKNKKNDKENINTILDENPLLKQGLFFGFYLIFFIVIILLIRSSYKTTNNNLDIKKTGYGYEYKLNRILNENYHFTYTEQLNDSKTIFEGDWLDNTISYKKSGTISTEYYYNNEKTYQKDPNSLTWLESENPISFFKIITPTNLNKIINYSKYTSRTEYIDSKVISFTYEIDAKHLHKIINNEEKEFTIPNDTIIVTISENKKLKSIELNLTNYYKTINNQITNYNLILNYSKYGEITEISNPIG